MDDLEESVDRIAATTGFSGVVRVDRGGSAMLAKAYGSAHRGHGIPLRSTPGSASPAGRRRSPH